MFLLYLELSLHVLDEQVLFLCPFLLLLDIVLLFFEHLVIGVEALLPPVLLLVPRLFILQSREHDLLAAFCQLVQHVLVVVLDEFALIVIHLDDTLTVADSLTVTVAVVTENFLLVPLLYLL